MRPSESDRETSGGPVLDVQGLRVSYGTAKVLGGVDLQVRPGEMVGLAGRNGAGKTTTLRAISGMVASEGGTIRSDGQQLPRNPESVLRAGVAHVPEGRHVFPSLSVLDNIRAAAYGASQPLDTEMVDRVRELFPPLERLWDRKAGVLSGGEQQMVAIARGVAARPRLLMIDEVSLGLAPRLVGDMWGALSAMRENAMTLLVVDQNVRIMAEHCDRLYLIDDGVTHEAGQGESGEAELRALYFD